MDNKTNVMRLLDKAKIKYEYHLYESKTALSGVEVAKMLNEDPDKVFKTLVTVGKSKNYYVFMISAEKELDLKKATRAVGEKSVEMIKMKELLPLTGYIHGGCSPIGMKKKFKTVIDINAKKYDTIIFSAGKIGAQIELAPNILADFIGAEFFDILKEA